VRRGTLVSTRMSVSASAVRKEAMIWLAGLAPWPQNRSTRPLRELLGEETMLCYPYLMTRADGRDVKGR